MWFEFAPLVVGMRHAQRVNFHRQRIQRELPVIDFFDRISSDLTDEELEYALEDVKSERRETEKLVFLMGSKTFQSDQQRVITCSAELKLVESELQMVVMKAVTPGMFQSPEFRSLVTKADELRKSIALSRESICTECNLAGVDPSEYLE